MKNLNLTLSLTEAGKCATKLAQGIDGPVYAMKMQNGKYICGLSFIIAIAEEAHSVMSLIRTQLMKSLFV